MIEAEHLPVLGPVRAPCIAYPRLAFDNQRLGALQASPELKLGLFEFVEQLGFFVTRHENDPTTCRGLTQINVGSCLTAEFVPVLLSGTAAFHCRTVEKKRESPAGIKVNKLLTERRESSRASHRPPRRPLCCRLPVVGYPGSGTSGRSLARRSQIVRDCLAGRSRLFRDLFGLGVVAGQVQFPREPGSADARYRDDQQGFRHRDAELDQSEQKSGCEDHRA